MSYYFAILHPLLFLSSLWNTLYIHDCWPSCKHFGKEGPQKLSLRLLWIFTACFNQPVYLSVEVLPQLLFLSHFCSSPKFQCLIFALFIVMKNRKLWKNNLHMPFPGPIVWGEFSSLTFIQWCMSLKEWLQACASIMSERSRVRHRRGEKAINRTVIYLIGFK